MNQELRSDAEKIVRRAIEAVKPDRAVQEALRDFRPGGRVILVAAGKAAWQMAAAASACLGDVLTSGVVITKYHHVQGDIPRVACYEGGHPTPDAGSYTGTSAALALTENLSEEDTVLFLLSGGGSALFEKPLIDSEELQDITGQLLACGADIREINTIRKRLSAVKGGRFAQWCAPAQVYSVILSDILGDPIDMIASGPTVADRSTCEQAMAVVKKYGLRLSIQAEQYLGEETPKVLDNSTFRVTGSVKELCSQAAAVCEELDYEVHYLTDCMECEARDAGTFLASILRSHLADNKKMAYIAGGETVVHLKGKGLGGRNQEIALAAAKGSAGTHRAAAISVGSDGTDGPTDAAGGYTDGDTATELAEKGLTVDAVLAENDAYHALSAVGGLIVTGPTGTNVNDVTVALLGEV